MKERYFLLREGEEFAFAPAMLLPTPESAQILTNPTRMQILRLLAKREMYPAEIAQKIGMHEQKVYYHIRQLLNSGILTITEKTEIRGTVAKRFRPVSMNFCLSLGSDWKTMVNPFGAKKDAPESRFLEPFVMDNALNASIVVGSPDPHGPLKARARDSHYAIELGLYLGQFCQTKTHFSAMLDVDVRLSSDPGNLILVGGPITNLIIAQFNDNLPARFSDKKPWEIIGPSGKHYIEETTGMVARMRNPLFPKSWILALAGIRSVGTKAAVLALAKGVSADFKGQEPYCHVINGFDLDGDGRVDSYEILD
ncbi:MAG: helix-turn-helix domain-containing protein [Nanoarchaeota archaeon]